MTHPSLPPIPTRRPRAMRGGTLAWVLGFLAIVGALAGVELYALYAHNRERTAAVPVAAPAARPISVPVGDVERPQTEAVVGPKIVLTGWATAPAGIRAVEIRMEGQVFPAKLGVTRLDVVRIRPDLGTKPDTGWEFIGDFTGDVPPPGVNRRILTIVAVGNDGRETVLGRKSLVEPAALARWADFTPKGTTPFYLLPALSGLDLNGASELDTIYAPYLSPTVRAGFRVPILYLRMTRGAAHDYVFDPDWDPVRKCGERRIGDDSLNAVIAHSKAKSLPVLVTLNGGIWADAYCDVPEWDVNDKLEKDLANDQWNERNEVMPDDYLKHLPGSHGRARARAGAHVQRLRERRSPLQEAQPAGGGTPPRRVLARASGPLRRRRASIRTRTSIRSSRGSSGTTTTRARCASSASGSRVRDRTRAGPRRACPTCARIAVRSR